ncbi:uncharacterized protein IUM83_05001 [Phytophthora cinnamomi]|uniref:uncharacterized protein n=1 Tax=Phytophthora cinnamomi TaxID=4785 RepID=UPI00355A096B|nr:hypothetical protein IUM83_05001 [Phytophthora cinnamomi]
MSTPDTIGAAHHIVTPAYSYDLRATELVRTMSTVRYSCGSSTIAWTSECDDDSDSDNDSGQQQQHPPTLETCSRAIFAAAERMVTLAREPRSLAVAIAYDECLDIVTAAVNHMEEIETRGVMRETILDAYRAMHRIRELLRPSPPVRRALQF